MFDPNWKWVLPEIASEKAFSLQTDFKAKVICHLSRLIGGNCLTLSG
jgi:hypothetical protein